MIVTGGKPRIKRPNHHTHHTTHQYSSTYPHKHTNRYNCIGNRATIYFGTTIIRTQTIKPLRPNWPNPGFLGSRSLDRPQSDSSSQGAGAGALQRTGGGLATLAMRLDHFTDLFLRSHRRSSPARRKERCELRLQASQLGCFPVEGPRDAKGGQGVFL